MVIISKLLLIISIYVNISSAKTVDFRGNRLNTIDKEHGGKNEISSHAAFNNVTEINLKLPAVGKTIETNSYGD